MQTNPIPGVMNTLKEAGFDEEQRMAIIKSTTDMQYPLLEAIENLETRMDARFEKLATRFEDLENRISNQTLILATLIVTSHLGVLALLKFGTPG